MAAPIRTLPLIAALALGLAACQKDGEPAEAKARGASAQTVTVANPQSRSLPRSITVSGPVAAVEEMQLGVELSGLRVTRLAVDVGQQVRRGQVLLILDHRMLDADLVQANAALREADAGAALARANLARGENLARDKFISAMQLDELRAARTQAEARLGTARAARDSTALRRSFADLRAPADGLISKRLVQPGQVVSAGMELLRLIKDGRLEWRAELPSEQLARVSPGDVIALVSRDGTRVDGRVRAVTPGVDAATRTGTVYADLPQPGTLQPGAFLEGRIDTGLVQAVVVPAAAVVLRDGFSTVFTVDAKGLAHQVRIEAGTRDNGQVEVRSGLKAGDRVVLAGAGFLADGDAVRVVDATQPAATP
ncbi:RND transporter [Lysobacter daejeonensis GH1-9]|uniref:RND transporter n=1 Tax=Lysobacter daejeonensis GH1-9 TaxID=1385517 RepID=A0A0A0EQ82_9GAMM|nr:efflux RND transporter periplasmic adaptor subunit [Lysobacter daejeonensis]KGM53156.1 RND transporter [Lysobacter daejeonensis GH1-9]